MVTLSTRTTETSFLWFHILINMTSTYLSYLRFTIKLGTHPTQCYTPDAMLHTRRNAPRFYQCPRKLPMVFNVSEHTICDMLSDAMRRHVSKSEKALVGLYIVCFTLAPFNTTGISSECCRVLSFSEFSTLESPLPTFRVQDMSVPPPPKIIVWCVHTKCVSDRMRSRSSNLMHQCVPSFIVVC